MDDLISSLDSEVTRPEGFRGQRLIRLPQDTLAALKQDALSAALYLTDIGFYPPVSHHAVQRPAGCPQHILIYCTRGEGWVRLENAPPSPVGAENLFILPADCAHAYGCAAGKSWELYWVHFSGDRSREMAARLCRGRLGEPTRFAYRGDTMRLFHAIIADLERGLTLDACRYANARLWHLFGDIAHHCKTSDRESGIVDQTIALMNSRVEESLSLAELAEAARLSVPYLSRLFKSRTELSPIDFFIRLKIQRACQYLDFTDMTIQEIGQAIGYDDPYYFSRIFKKVMGHAPSHYRTHSVADRTGAIEALGRKQNQGN